MGERNGKKQFKLPFDRMFYEKITWQNKSQRFTSYHSRRGPKKDVLIVELKCPRDDMREVIV